ncbi:MAG: carbon storage regulator [Pirellulaceae bacterium]|jgi:carbon storage regulator
MLVLSRKTQEEIVIGDVIKVTVLKVKGSTVKLGIEAPKDLRVRRSELIAKDMATEELAAANSTEASSTEASSTEAAEKAASNKVAVAKSGLTLCDYIAHKDAAEVEASNAEESELPNSPEAKSTATAATVEYIPYYAI